MNPQPGAVIEDQHGRWRVIGLELADRRAEEDEAHNLIALVDLDTPSRRGYLKLGDWEGQTDALRDGPGRASSPCALASPGGAGRRAGLAWKESRLALAR